MSFAKITPTGSFVNSGSLGSLNHLSGSSFSGRSQLPFKINFKDGWRKGPMEEWYQLQKKLSSTFKSLEYRKERESPFFHEFILVDLGNDTVCRFDRRGDVNNRANVIIGEPIPSEDTAHVIAKSPTEQAYTEIYGGSDLLLRMQFPKGQDLLTILAICYGIHKNKNTQSYSLTRYNCYFFSWMIITATARCTVDWAILAHESSMWESLVAAVMNGLRNDPGPGPKTTIPVTHATKNKDDSRVSYEFVGSTYLVNTLRKALYETRQQIRKSLAELILHSTVDKAMYDVSKTSAQKAANQAARSHAAQAARDAAMEAVIETMWRDIMSSSEGGSLWERKCRLAEECVRNASAAAADVADQSHLIATPSPETPALEAAAAAPGPTSQGVEPAPAPPAKWETAWDASWAESWTSENQQSNINGEDSDLSKRSISARAKAAWKKAWEEALQANEEYVPVISRGVADYVTKNLPEALPEVLTYETDTNVIKSMVKVLIPTSGSSNSKLQEWVKARIQEHCQRVIRVTAGAQQPSRLEFEDTMKAVWESTVNCLGLPGIPEESSE
ncbi:hypothetical protein OPQ81_001113 [Rhizoctonia solani]|nr:hypothetical protein OPQ81_001113 [Rhizoctonia solani]